MDREAAAVIDRLKVNLPSLDSPVALMSGAIVATLLTMVVVPLLYWELMHRRAGDTDEAHVADLQRADAA